MSKNKIKFKVKAIYESEDENDYRGIVVDNLEKPDEQPWIFRIGDTIVITEDGELGIQNGRAYESKKLDLKMDIGWLHKRFYMLYDKMSRNFRGKNFISQTDVYEYNFIRELLNGIDKQLEDEQS